MSVFLVLFVFTWFALQHLHSWVTDWSLFICVHSCIKSLQSLISWYPPSNDTCGLVVQGSGDCGSVTLLQCFRSVRAESYCVSDLGQITVFKATQGKSLNIWRYGFLNKHVGTVNTALCSAFIFLRFPHCTKVGQKVQTK